MNKIKKLTALFMIFVIIALSFPIYVLAADSTINIITLDSESNISVVIEYDVEKPSISFISPGGKSVTTKSPNVTVVESDKKINYRIYNAEAGQWQMKYDKKTNGTLNYTAVLFDEGIWIDSVSLGDIKGNYLPVSFTAAFASDIYYNYEISAVTSKNAISSGAKVLASGTATANSNQTINVDLSSLSTYDKYYIYVSVNYSGTGGAIISDYAISDKSFSYENSNTLEAIEDFVAIINLSDDTIYVDFEDYTVNCNKYIVSLFNSDDKSSPIAFREINSNEASTSFLIDPSEVTKYTISVVYVYNGITSKSLDKSFDLASKKRTAAIDTEEITNSNQVSISYTMDTDVNATISLNGNEETVALKKGTSLISKTLSNGDNEISFVYPIAKNVYVRLNKTISIDKIAPKITLYENLNHIVTTLGSYEIIGEVDTNDDVTLTINSKEVAIDENGCFKHKVNLKFGENLIRIEAVDKAGNGSSTFALIEQQSAINGVSNLDVIDFLPLIISTIILTVLTILYLILVKRRKSDEHAAVKLIKGIIALLSILSIIDLAFLVWRIITRIQLHKLLSSFDYYKLVESSFDAAYNKIGQYNNTIREIVFLAILFVILIVFIVLFKKLLGKAKTWKIKERKRKEKQPKVKKAPKQPIRPSENTSRTVSIEAKVFYCPHCGYKYDKKPSFCGNCGNKIE